jgi:hypothetical protein
MMTNRRHAAMLGILIGCAALVGARARGFVGEAPLKIAVSFGPEVSGEPLDGRLLLLLSTDDSTEPRFQISDTSLKSQQVFGLDIEGMKAGEERIFDSDSPGYPVGSFDDLRIGDYNVQAVLHKYETFHRADGHVVKLPMDRGEGQQWNRAPGNLYCAPQKMRITVQENKTIHLRLNKVIPPIPDPPATKYVKHERIRSELLSKFWGRDVYLGAHVLLPEGFDAHPDARYPLVIDHGHFPHTFEGWRETPPDAGLKCEPSERFHLDCYNRTEQEAAWQLYKDWTSPLFPRVLLIEIQHANPYYDDSYAVNSENLGPYGDAIVRELIPYIEKKYRALGAGWARFMYGGSTGGWEALGAQVFYPDEFNGCYAACPDPIDFRAYTVVNIYDDDFAYEWTGPFKIVPKPGHRDHLGHISSTLRQMNQLELVLGAHTRSGGQWDIWEAVFSPAGPDGYPKRIWDKQTGVIDRSVARYWQEHYDLSYALRRDWNRGLGRKLQGKIHIYVGEADNYYLNNAVYLMEEFLKSTKDPHYDGEVDYEPRAEHCWNGDHTRPNALSRLRYPQMFIPRIAQRLVKTAPPGADVKSWRY